MAEKLTKDDVAHVAHLARLEMSEPELETYTEQLSAILGYVDQLSAVNTNSIESATTPTTSKANRGDRSSDKSVGAGLVNVLQDDEPAADSLVREEFLASAPATQPPHVKVKAVLE